MSTQQWEIVLGDVREEIKRIPDESVDCCVTSPPYWRMRDYGHADQIGLEPSVAEFVDAIASVMDEVRRVLKPEGTAWMNLGDAYIRRGGGRTTGDMGRRYVGTPGRSSPGLKPGDLAGTPWRVAFECQDRGWWLRSDIVWRKPNALPDGARSRPATAHEYLFLLTKSASSHYYYDDTAVLEPFAPKTATTWGSTRHAQPDDGSGQVRAHGVSRDIPDRLPATDDRGQPLQGSRLRSVWTIAPNAKRGICHFAMMPIELARRCVLIGCPDGGLVLDPFCGAATTAIAALRNGRRFLGIELVPNLRDAAVQRLEREAPLLYREAAAAQ